MEDSSRQPGDQAFSTGPQLTEETTDLVSALAFIEVCATQRQLPLGRPLEKL